MLLLYVKKDAKHDYSLEDFQCTGKDKRLYYVFGMHSNVIYNRRLSIYLSFSSIESGPGARFDHYSLELLTTFFEIIHT